MPVRPVVEWLTTVRLPGSALVGAFGENRGSLPESVNDPTPSPLVSVIVRSMGRPELALALTAIARQEHPAVETIVVDATGGRHPALPTIDWRAGHTLRLVSAGKPLKRAPAAALGLASARGEWLTFLDDDDTCEPGHLAALVAAAAAHPDALVVYGSGRLFDAEGRLQRVFGRPFNRALMHYGPLFYWQAALIRTRVRELGCGFDAAFDVCEDRDFLAQIAQHGDFAFAPHVATFNYRPDLGTSGTGEGANRNVARLARYDNLLRAKWAGHGTYHTERVSRRCRIGVRAYHAGDHAAAQRAFEHALADYPDDPNALHGLARLHLVRGQRADAEHYARRAVDINAAAGEYQATLAEILGHVEGPAAPRNAAVSRTAPCPCGSGLRYKTCCGRLPAAVGDTGAPQRDPRCVEAERHVARGEAERARDVLRQALAGATPDRETLVAAARVELALDDASAAFALLERASEWGADAEIGMLLNAAAERCSEQAQHASHWAMARTVMARACARHAETRDDRVRVRILLGSASGEAAAARFAAAIVDNVDVRIVRSPQDLAPGDRLVLWEPHEPDPTLAQVHPARATVRLARDDPDALLRCLVALEELWPDAALDCTVPHESAARTAGPHAVLEYPWIDPALLGVPACAAHAGPLRLGRCGIAAMDHPNDPALFRALRADGHAVLLPPTPFFRAAFVHHGGAEWLGADAALDALPRLDVVVLRSAGAARGMLDAAVLGAMAAARPLVAFNGSVGAREWLVDGGNAYLVDSEDEVLARVRALAHDPRLRAAMGAHARRTAEAVMAAQRERVRRRYRATSLIE